MRRYAQHSAALSVCQPQSAMVRMKQQVRIQSSGSFPSRKEMRQQQLRVERDIRKA